MGREFPVSVHPVTGPPGAGKTTALMSLDQRNARFTRFGVRDYGLRLAQEGHPLGLEMRDTLLRGELLTNDLVQHEFTHFLDGLPDRIRSVAVEGYPRDLAQCGDLVRAVASRGGRLGPLVMIEVSDDLVRARVARRRICADCGLPAPEAACPDCGGPATVRGDDGSDRLARRLSDHRRLGEEVGAYFADLGLLEIVDGTRPAEEVTDALAALLLHEAALEPSENGART